MIVQYCEDSRQKLFGTPCIPLQIASEELDDNDANNITITATSVMKGKGYSIYEGTALPLDTDSGSGSGA